jgi:hypothetical protein
MSYPEAYDDDYCSFCSYTLATFINCPSAKTCRQFKPLFKAIKNEETKKREGKNIMEKSKLTWSNNELRQLYRTCLDAMNLLDQENKVYEAKFAEANKILNEPYLRPLDTRINRLRKCLSQEPIKEKQK